MESDGPLDQLSAFGHTLRDNLSHLTGQLAGIGREDRSRAGSGAESLDVISPRVLLIIYDPIVDRAGNITLSQSRRWNKVDELVEGFIADIAGLSDGLVQYRVIERRVVDEWPVKEDGFVYDAQSLDDVLAGRAAHHMPDFDDYHKIVADFNLLARAANDELDEVWLFGFPYGGFYESRMCGAGAFWCNAPALENTDSCRRRFVIMGFSYERGVGEMLESFGHRVESTMKQVYRHTSGDANLWARFIRHDKTDPGLSEVGTLHYAPNSDTDYDWGNPRPVISRHEDWYNYPDFSGESRQVTCADWGNGDIRAHHRWWLSHLPRLAGSTRGIGNNWWAYAADPDNVQP